MVGARTACGMLLAPLLGISSAVASGPGHLQTPLGVFAHVSIEDAIARHPGQGTPTEAELHRYLRGIYASLLENDAISGISAGRHWDNIQLANPFCILSRACPANTVDGYDWSYIDDVFAAANAAHKSVQLIITPGVDTPTWLLDFIPSCDGLFTSAGTAPPDCGKATFQNFPEESERADGDVMPLPWNPLYIAAWDAFLIKLAARYEGNPAFTYITVAGPVLASDEMILPTSADGSSQISGEPSDKAWATLIQHSFPYVARYRDSDQVFVDAWEQAIDTYEATFSGITLTLFPDGGNAFPEPAAPLVVAPDDQNLFAIDCANASANQISCAAKTEIIAYFLKVGGRNAKSTAVGGMIAGSPLATGDIGTAGVKVLTSLSPAPVPPILGGAEFDLPVSSMDPATIQHQGCPQWPSKPASCDNLTPEEIAYNTFTVFFNGTLFGSSWGGADGTQPIQFVEIDYTDVLFAESESCPTPPNTIPGNPSLQDLLSEASNDLYAIAGKPTTPFTRSCQ